ncbi:hypothetical protein [Microbulbifer sp. ZKSA002]|uniref:hypothetical protein n=1 Tax=Microbulbifer sp. ZKSA002 TaxID=3243388 RepID=UPI00403A4A26
MKLKITSIFLAIIMLGGCTRTLVATYEPGVNLEHNGISGTKLAVYQFEDSRSWIDKNDEKSKSFIGKQGAWKFGLKYEGIEYQPVAQILQDVFIKDFKMVGVDAFKGEGSTSPSYSLKGKILNFEFENETGLVTVTSRRHVSLVLTLSDKEGRVILANELFNEVSRENEGMGVLHSTNVDKLMKEALKEVVVSVINRTNTELAHVGLEAMSVSLNDVDITPFLDSMYYAGINLSQ